MIDRECYLIFCLIIFMIAVPCYSHESLFDGKTMYAGKELWKETLPLQSGSRVYRLEGLKSNSWYEVKISYPASIPALFSLQLLKDGEMGLKLNHMRRLLNTEKLIFKSESLENKDGLYVLVTVEPEGIVAIPNSKDRSFIIYNIVCEEQLLGIAYSCWSVVVLVVLCLVVALILPRFLPSHLLIKDGDRDR
ncbi:Caveolin-1 protein [Hirschfeldia incana]|nr:Caveolin-1 protein [Hirschfeldia incana]